MVPIGNRRHEVQGRAGQSGDSQAPQGSHGGVIKPRVAIVGVCGSGKSLLAGMLAESGYDARPVAQEHSLVPNLYMHHEPDAVIYLEASDDTVARRKSSRWEPRLLSEQRRRLQQARGQADIILVTDALGPDELAAEAGRRLADLF